MTDDPDRLVTAVEARSVAGIPNDRVRKWSHTRQVIARGSRGRFKLYRLGDLIELNRLAEFHPLARK